MIRENQKLLNQLNILSDGLILLLALPPAFWFRFHVLPGGVVAVPLKDYLLLNALLALFQMGMFQAFGLYGSFRRTPLRKELPKLWRAGTLGAAVLFSWLFLGKGTHYSRLTWAVFFLLAYGCLTGKRIVLRQLLRWFRSKGYNQKHVLLVGSGPLAEQYLREICSDPALGYQVVGCVTDQAGAHGLRRLGGFEDLAQVLEETTPDEVVSALELEEFQRTPGIIAACEKAGIRLAIIPFYTSYMPGTFQIDDLNGIPMMSLRRLPLDNAFHAFCKRTMDIVGSAALLVLTSPVMLVCAIGVRLSSPGPVIFRQERVGRDRRLFYMYKFRSMRVNDREDTAWSKAQDGRRTRFGAFLRKYSLDEFPQFWNVLKGDMSLVGPRPELPHFVNRFREDVPQYMVKHQVRPGITGWAQVNGLRGDTSIPERVAHDLYYIEHWSFLFDLQILWMTVFGGKFKNEEEIAPSCGEREEAQV